MPTLHPANSRKSHALRLSCSAASSFFTPILMQTILSTVSLLCSVGCFLLNLFVVTLTQYFELEDLKTGAVSTHDAVKEVNKVGIMQVVLVEVVLHWVVGVVAFVRWEWVVAVATLPLSLSFLAQ